MPGKQFKMPRPDAHGNRWFGKPGESNEPAILAILTGGQGGWMLSLGVRGLVWDERRLMRFGTPDDALKALQNLSGGA